MTTNTSAPPPAVALSGAVLRYGTLNAVDRLDLDLRGGETVALLGRNGAGKSSTINLLLGLAPPAEGSVRLFGAEPERAVRAGRVGAMLQDGQPLARVTVRELVSFVAGCYPHPMPVGEALELAGLEAFAGRRVDKLSGGQAQRVRFAVAVAGAPDLLVLDEPTAALDVEARRVFWQSMRSYAGRGRTVLFSTHYLEEADAHADRIVVLDAGRVVADGSGAEVKRTVGGAVVSFDVTGPPADTSDTSELTAGLGLLPGVTSAEVRDGRAHLRCADSDATVRALAERGLVRGLEVSPASLEDAFLSLTSATVGEAAWMFAYVLLEVRRTLRDTGYVIFGIGMPLLMYVLFTNLDTGNGSGSRTWAVLSMVGLAAYGALGAAVSIGTGVAEDKSRGWLRQLRVTPLSPARVVVARALTGSVTVLPAIGAVLAAGALVNGVRLEVWQWIALPAVLCIGTLPFTMLGIGNGYRLSSQTTGVVNMACMVGLSVLGGLWFPIEAFPGWLQSVSAWTPSHAFAELGWAVTGGGAPGAGTVGLISAWFVLFGGYALHAYRRSARTV